MRNLFSQLDKTLHEKINRFKLMLLRILNYEKFSYKLISSFIAIEKFSNKRRNFLIKKKIFNQLIDNKNLGE